MKKLLLLFLAFWVFPLAARAQTPEEIASKYGVTFPIAELGSCSSYSDCRTYCEDPLHYDQCIAFAKDKGFYQESDTRDLLQQAQSELGCSSEATCRSFCEQPANYNRCSAFAERHDLTGGYSQDPSQGDILESAKQYLGCTSYATCRQFCEQPANADKCSQFAQQVGLEGGHRYEGPGGCTTEETCRAFCDQPQNYQICQSYSQSQGAGEFSGPGGCKSESECRAYCQSHPRECGEPAAENYDPIQACNQTPNCSWANNTCTCQSMETINPDEYCRQYPDRCQGYEDPAKACTKYPGCSWTGSYCQCQPSGTGYPTYTPSTYSPYPAYTPPAGYDPATECVKYPGCSWTGNGCQCQAMSTPTSTSYPTPTAYSQSSSQPVETNPPGPTPYSQPDPASECTKNPGCSWTGSICQCTQGASTSAPGVFPALWQCLFGR